MEIPHWHHKQETIEENRLSKFFSQSDRPPFTLITITIISISIKHSLLSYKINIKTNTCGFSFSKTAALYSGLIMGVLRWLRWWGGSGFVGLYVCSGGEVVMVS
jgi:hypothetical protein